jgi:Gpi18-like mannosyltransferase
MVLSLAIGILVAIPWSSSSPEVAITGFPVDRLSIDALGDLERPGQVRVAPQEIELSAVQRSQPTVHVLTAEVPFTAEFDVAVRNRRGSAFPFQIKVWSPRVDAALEAWYGPDGAISAGARTNDRWKFIRRLDGYSLGAQRHWKVTRDYRDVTIETWAAGHQSTVRVSRETFPQLLAERTLSLTIYASVPATGHSVAVLRNPVFTVPRQVLYGSALRNKWYRFAVFLAVLACVLWVGAHAEPRSVVLTALRSVQGNRPKVVLEVGVILLLALGAILMGQRLSRISGYPYDVRSLEVWSRIAQEHGPAAIPGHSLLATVGDAQGGQPYSAVTYPYPPIPIYFPWLASKLAPVSDAEQTLKRLFVLGAVAGGIVLFAMLRHLGIRPSVAISAATIYLLNPVTMFDSAVWGQMDAFVALFLLLGGAGAALKSAPLLWTGLLLAALTKQTGGLFAPVLVAIGTARLGFRPMLRGLPQAIILSFLIIAPLLLSGIAPNTIYRPIVTKALDFGTVRAMEVTNAVVSQSAFTAWSALAGLEGSSGWARLAFPDYLPSRFGPSYSILSRVLFILFTLALCLFFLRRRDEVTPGTTFLALAAYGVAIATLLTRVQSRYIYFGVMFTAISFPWMPRWLGWAVLVILSGTALVSMWGIFVFTSIWYPGLLREFQPDRSWLNSAMASALGSDIGITIGGVLNTAALVGLLVALWMSGCGRTPRPFSDSVGDV